MAFQIRVTATCRLVNRSTGSTPGRPFQISTSRAAGHFSANAASSCRLLKVSVSPALSVTCSPEVKAVILFSASIWNVVIRLLSSGVSLLDDIHASERENKQVISRKKAQKHREVDLADNACGAQDW